MRQKSGERKPTPEEIGDVLSGWGSLKFFPSDAGALRAIAGLLHAMVGTIEGLRWLDQALINRVGEWVGPAELRGIYTSRFKPADGIEGKGYSSIAGFTPAESETAQLERHRERAVCAGERTGKLLPAAAITIPGSIEQALTDSEKAEYAALQERIQKATAKRALRDARARRRPDPEAPKWLENLA